MTRAIPLVVVVLALAGCQEEPAPGAAPTVEEQEAADVELAAVPGVDHAMCDLLAGKHAEQLKQTMVIYDRLTGAIAAKEQDRAAELNETIADALAKSGRTRAEMKRQGCPDIPAPPNVGVISSPPADDK